MLAAITRLDALTTASRPLWVWAGQLAVIVLGVHLAADRLDDLLYARIAPLPWPSPDNAVTAATWGALVLELVVVTRAAAALLLTEAEPALSWATWKRNWSVDAVVLPLFWAPTAIGGAWVVGMAVEDAVAPHHADAARALAWVATALVGWRLGWTGWRRVVGGLGTPKRRVDGWWWAPALLVVGATAARHVPIWGIVGLVRQVLS